MNAPACVAILPATSLIGASSGSRPARVLDGLIRDARRARGHQPARQLGLGGEVQVGEQRLPLAQQRDLLRLGLLDLQHQLGLARTPPRASGTMRAPCARNCSSLIALPSPAPACTSTSCPRVAQLAHARGRDRDAVLVGLDLARDSDPHRASSRPRSASQNSMRSRALEKSRPVSCSTRRMR